MEHAGASQASEELTAVSRHAPMTVEMPDGATMELVCATPSMRELIAKSTKVPSMSQSSVHSTVSTDAWANAPMCIQMMVLDHLANVTSNAHESAFQLVWEPIVQLMPHSQSLKDPRLSHSERSAVFDNSKNEGHVCKSES